MSTETTTLQTYTFERAVSKTLAESTDNINRAIKTLATTLEDSQRIIAVELSKVAEKESYKSAGLGTLVDYGAKFGMKSTMTYALRNAGDIYRQKDVSKKVLEFTPAKLAEIAPVMGKSPAERVEAIEKAVDEGKISPATTLKDLRAYAADVKASRVKRKDSTKPEILPRYTVEAAIGAGLGPLDIEAIKNRLESSIVRADEKSAVEWDVKRVAKSNIVHLTMKYVDSMAIVTPQGEQCICRVALAQTFTLHKYEPVETKRSKGKVDRAAKGPDIRKVLESYGLTLEEIEQIAKDKAAREDGAEADYSKEN